MSTPWLGPNDMCSNVSDLLDYVYVEPLVS